MGNVVSLSLQIRRFRCPAIRLPAPDLRRTPAYGGTLPKPRRTARLADVQRSLALATGG